MSVKYQIDEYIASKEQWKQDLLSELRKLIVNSDGHIQEAWKWSVPVFKINKDICSIATFKTHVKLNFFKGAHLDDPDQIFNAGLESKNSRSIDFKEGDTIPVAKVNAMIKRAIDLDTKK